MTKDWKKLINDLGFFGKQEQPGRPDKNGPLDEFVEKLRSGGEMPAAAVRLLAELFDPREASSYSFKFALVPIPERIREFEKGADSIEIGLEVERLVRDDRLKVSHAVQLIAEFLEKDERSIWRLWRLHKSFYPQGALDSFERANPGFRNYFRVTDKK